ncbi:hypothetical protein [Arthrobacter sp. MA-N2]|nr:hypothetical protein [Arthrobacter sp. MA-N2]
MEADKTYTLTLDEATVERVHREIISCLEGYMNYEQIIRAVLSAAVQEER